MTPTAPRQSRAAFDIEHQAAQQRFACSVDGQICIADYRLADGVMAMTHTYVPANLEGRGIAAALVAAALAYAREHRLKVDPLCSYVRVYMQRHVDTQDLLA